LEVGRLSSTATNNLKLKPHINQTTIVNENESKWVKISGQIKVDKPYQYLIIGNFFSNEDTQIKTYKNYTGTARIPPYAYYLVDDVRMWYEGMEAENKSTNKPLAQDKIIENALVEFEHDSAIIKTNSTANLDSLIRNILPIQAQYKIEIVGHTDNTGTTDYNLDLSSRRAQSVLNYMLDKGVLNNNISSIGLGESQPIMKNDTEENKLRNRRVEIVLRQISSLR